MLGNKECTGEPEGAERNRSSGLENTSANHRSRPLPTPFAYQKKRTSGEEDGAPVRALPSNNRSRENSPPCFSTGPRYPAERTFSPFVGSPLDIFRCFQFFFSPFFRSIVPSSDRLDGCRRARSELARSARRRAERLEKSGARCLCARVRGRTRSRMERNGKGSSPTLQHRRGPAKSE